MEERKIIIIIEDDPSYSELILDELELEENNWEVVLTKDGQGVIDYLQKAEIIGNGKENPIISLIILGLSPTEICEVGILEFIKNSQTYCTIPTVSFSNIAKPASYGKFIEKLRVLKQYC